MSLSFEVIATFGVSAAVSFAASTALLLLLAAAWRRSPRSRGAPGSPGAPGAPGAPGSRGAPACGALLPARAARTQAAESTPLAADAAVRS